jgi:hypothetical protein
MYSVFKKGNFVMTNPIFNPQPNYSGVTIQITNPAVYTGQGNSGTPFVSGGYLGADKCNCNCIGTNSQGYISYPQGSYAGQKVQQGQLVGYVGHTGNAKGDHLHYMVTKPNRYDWWNAQDSTVNPLPFATSSIFEGGANTSGTDSIIDNNNFAKTIGVSKLHANNIGGIAAPIVNSIGDLKNTIIKLSEQTSRNQKIMDALVNRTMESPTV